MNSNSHHANQMIALAAGVQVYTKCTEDGQEGLWCDGHVYFPQGWFDPLHDYAQAFVLVATVGIDIRNLEDGTIIVGHHAGPQYRFTRHMLAHDLQSAVCRICVALGEMKMSGVDVTKVWRQS